MKNLIFIAAFMLISGIVFSQKDNDSGRMARLTEELSLSSKQVKQVKALYKANKDPQIKRAKPSQLTDADKAAVKAERQAKRAKIESEMKEILTPEQFEKFASLHKSRKGKGHGKGKVRSANRSNDRVQKLTEALKLSETQQKEIAQIIEENRPSKKERIDKKVNLTEEQKKARKEQHLASRQMAEKKIAQVLTPEQLEKYKTMIKNRKGKNKSK